MRKLVVPVLALLILLFAFRPQPLTYHLGSIDPKFGISESVAESTLQDAANRWNVALKKTAVRIDTGDAGYTVNFVFDYRQQYQNSITSIKERYSYLDQTKSTIKWEQTFLELEGNRLDEEGASLKSEIDSWNSIGGATGKAYDDLKTRRQKYNADVQSYNKRQAALDKEVKDYNTRIDEYNNALAQLQEAFKIAGGSLDENAVGIYNTSDRSITIYSYSDLQELRFTLMHELGHALGCAHASNPDSIMYPKMNDSQNMADPKPTLEDLRNH
jgi:hypothetical protein